jgi:hypothetical protein
MPRSSIDTHPWTLAQSICAMSASGPSAIKPAAMPRWTALTSYRMPGCHLIRLIAWLESLWGLLEHDLVQHRIGLSERPVARPAFLEPFVGVLDLLDGNRGFPEPLEALHVEGLGPSRSDHSQAGTEDGADRLQILRCEWLGVALGLRRSEDQT